MKSLVASMIVASLGGLALGFAAVVALFPDVVVWGGSGALIGAFALGCAIFFAARSMPSFATLMGSQNGQTIVVRAKACVAIEAMEGTDATIRRAGELANGKLTVVKVAKPDQDMRFDVPVVGVPTIETMIAAGATCLSVTAGKTLIFDQDQMLALANKNSISIIGS
jgi:hypothetical protein